MNLWKILEALLRRWRIAVPMIILAAVVVLRVYGSISPTYVASGQILLTSPTVDTDLCDNPILCTTNALGTAAEAGAARIYSPEVVEELFDQGYSEYEVSVSPTDPILLFTASDTSPLRAEQTVSRLFSRFEEEMAELQRSLGAPDDSFINTIILQQPASLIESSSRIRTTLIAFVASGLAVLVVTLAWDEIRRPIVHEDSARYAPMQGSAAPLDDVGDDPPDEDEPPRRSRWTRAG